MTIFTSVKECDCDQSGTRNMIFYFTCTHHALESAGHRYKIHMQQKQKQNLEKNVSNGSLL